MERNSKAPEKEYAKVETCVITRVHEGQRKGLVFFDACINGVYINGMSVVPSERGDFISFPAHKGIDGKWYNYAFVRFSPEDQKRIMADVQRKLDE